MQMHMHMLRIRARMKVRIRQGSTHRLACAVIVGHVVPPAELDGFANECVKGWRRVSTHTLRLPHTVNLPKKISFDMTGIFTSRSRLGCACSSNFRIICWEMYLCHCLVDVVSCPFT